MKIKILSYNVHKLFDITRRNYFLSQLKELLTPMDLDFVFLQEFRGLQPAKYEEDFSDDPLEHLADNVWDHFVYGKNAIHSNGHHGNAILSKYPFETWENFDISNHPWEKRGLLWGKVRVDERPLSIYCTHLDLTALGRRRQIRKIEKILSAKADGAESLIFCGDFNDWSGETSKLVKDLGVEVMPKLPDENHATFPSFFPVLSLDKIFFKNAKCAHVSVLEDDHWKKLSDHLPLYAEIEI